MSREIVVATGPCAAETEQQVMDAAYNISLVRGIAQPYGIQFKLRAGAWKPRTFYYNKNGEKVFEGTREEGLQWLARAAETLKLSIVTEVMSENDLRHYERFLEPERDFLQVGARNNQNFALLYAVGGTSFNVLLKSPQHGVDVEDAMGSLQRLKRNRTKVYCVRGQKKFIHPDGIPPESHKKYMAQLLSNPNQHPDSRNLNNIGSISLLKQHPYFVENGILLCYDPSHTFGGKTDLMRRKIGEFAIKGIKEYGYDWIILETHDRSAHAIVDGPQALLTTLNGIDWSQTNAGKEPEIKPLTLVDIVGELMEFQVEKGLTDGKRLQTDKKELEKIRWGMSYM